MIRERVNAGLQARQGVGEAPGAAQGVSQDGSRGTGLAGGRRRHPKDGEPGRIIASGNFNSARGVWAIRRACRGRRLRAGTRLKATPPISPQSQGLGSICIRRQRHMGARHTERVIVRAINQKRKYRINITLKREKNSYLYVALACDVVATTHHQSAASPPKCNTLWLISPIHFPGRFVDFAPLGFTAKRFSGGTLSEPDVDDLVDRPNT